MSDGASAAPAAAPAATSGPQNTQNQPPSKLPQPGKPAQASKDAAPAWTEKDDVELTERLKRSPYGKRKVNGKEESVSDIKDLQRWLLDSQRGVGANQLVEQTKKERAEAAAAKKEAESHMELVKRARAGDVQARRELGLVPDEEKQQIEREWEALDPAVKRLVQENQQYRQQLQERLEEEQRLMQERTEKEKAAKRDETLKRAREIIPAVMKDLREELHDVALPDIIQAMEVFKEAGQRIGVDYTPEQLRLYIEQQREAGVWEHVGRTKPDAALKRVAPILKGLKAEQLSAALGEDFVPLARAFSAAWIAHHKRGQGKATPGNTTQQQSQPEPQREKPSPLTPFRLPPRR